MSINPIQLLKLIALLALGAALFWGGSVINEWREGYLQNIERGKTMTTAAGVSADGQEAAAATAQVEQGVTAARNTYNNAKQEAVNNDPDTRAWADARVPQRLLDAARQRRLDRERAACARSGRAGDECATGTGTAVAEQRQGVLP